MKSRFYLILFLFIAITVTFIACNSQNNKNGTTEQKGTEKVVYTCPMHPEVISDKPGKCPKCGMDLVKKEPADNKAMMNNDSTGMMKK